jgi:hypothetical protein
MYFEKQLPHSQTCVLHALNNVMQREVVRRDDFTALADKFADLKGHHVANVVAFYRKLLGDRAWSGTMARLWLMKNNIPHIWDVSHCNFLVGRFFIEAVIDGKSRHAIAVVDGYILDSLLSGPIRVKELLKNYEIVLVCQLTGKTS